MPELPEVEAARKVIAENCIGKKITRSVVADDVKVIDGVSRSDFEASITGKTIVGAHRKGKHMWIQLDSPPFPSFHFGLSGELYIKGVSVTKFKRFAVNDTDLWPSKYSKFFIELDDGLELSFTDKIRFARVRLLENPTSVPPISKLGPDALLEAMTEDELFIALSKKKGAIKGLLLDQSFISGVGNWIADEVLYQAKIHPLQSAASIPKEGCAALHKSLKEVIEYSVEVDADYTRLPVDWLCHYRWGKKPGKLNGKTIKFISAGGRTSAYVPELQKLTAVQALKAAQEMSRNKEENEVESESEEIAKAKGAKKTTQNQAKEPPTKHINDTSDEDEKKPSIRKKSNGSLVNKTLTARKGNESDGESESDSGGDEVKGKEVGKKGRQRMEIKAKPGRTTWNLKHSGRVLGCVFGYGIERKIAGGYETGMGLSYTLPSKPYSCLLEPNRNTQNPKYPEWVLGYGIGKNLYCRYESCMRLDNTRSYYPKLYTRLPEPYENTQNSKHLGRVFGRVFGHGIEKNIFCRYETSIRFGGTRLDYPKPYTCSLLKPYALIINPKIFSFCSPLILV